MSGTPCACAYFMSAAALGAAGRLGVQPGAIGTSSLGGIWPLVRFGTRFGRLEPIVGGRAMDASPPFGGPGVGTGVGVGVACGRPIAHEAARSVNRTRDLPYLIARYGTGLRCVVGRVRREGTELLR